MSPQTGQGSPVRPCTRSPVLFSALSVAAPLPAERVDRVAQRRRAAPRSSRSTLGLGQLRGRLERRQLGRVQDLVGVRVADAGDHRLVAAAAPLSWPPCAPSSIAASRPRSSAGSSGSGPSRAMPGTVGRVARPGTPPAASGCPASVRSKPLPSSRCSRSASGPCRARRRRRQLLLPLQPAGPGQVGDQVQRPSAAISRSRNLPCRPAPVIVAARPAPSAAGRTSSAR